jgi:hypothetical protein
LLAASPISKKIYSPIAAATSVTISAEARVSLQRKVAAPVNFRARGGVSICVEKVGVFLSKVRIYCFEIEKKSLFVLSRGVFVASKSRSKYNWNRAAGCRGLTMLTAVSRGGREKREENNSLVSD